MVARLLRKVIRITSKDSPNVQLGLRQLARGIRPSNEIIVPGVLSWAEYQDRLATLTEDRKKVMLDAEFYEGPEIKLYPAEWRQRAILKASQRGKDRGRLSKAMGVDSGEGRANTAWIIGDLLGVTEGISKKTPDTSIIWKDTISLMRQHGIEAGNVLFDRGGGGKQHADRLHDMGIMVRTVAFGESVSLEPKRGMTLIEDRKEVKAERSIFKNRRAQMAWDIREQIDPSREPESFAIPDNTPPLAELHRQMGIIPLWWDAEGQLKLPRKQRPDGDANNREQTLTEMIGHSPDEWDALMLLVHGLLHKGTRVQAGTGR